MNFTKEKYLLCLLFLLPLFAHSQNTANGIWAALVRKETKFGYVNNRGVEIVPVQFNQVGIFREGCVWVNTQGTSGQSATYGMYDKYGKEIIPVKYSRVGNMNSGLVPVKNDDGKWGYMNAEGKVVLAFVYKHASDFQSGIANVMLYDQEKSVYINTRGEIVYDNNKEPYDIWLEFEEFSEGKILFYAGGYYGFLDHTGKIAIPTRYKVQDHNADRYLLYFHNGYAMVGKHISQCSQYEGRWVACKKYGFIDTLGNLKFDYNFFSAHSFHDCGLAYVSIYDGNDSKDSYLKLNGDYLFPPGKYRVSMGGWGGGSAGDLLINNAIFLSSGKQSGIMNIEGEMIIPFGNYMIRPASGGNYIVSRKTETIYQYAVYDAFGKKIQDFITYSYGAFPTFADPELSEGFIAYADTIVKKYGFKNQKYETVISPQFHYVMKPFKQGIAITRDEHNKLSGIDTTGKYLFTGYDVVEEFKNIDIQPETQLLYQLQFTSTELNKYIQEARNQEEE